MGEATTSAKVTEFLERAAHYAELKRQMSHLPIRLIFEQMEISYRNLAESQEQLERSKRHVEALDR